MTIRELTALVLLYRACPDPELKRKVARLLPEIEEIAGMVGAPDGKGKEHAGVVR